MATTLRLWFITDGRPGHLNQLRGLAERLEAKVPCQIHWLDISQQGFRKAGRSGLCGQFAASSLPDWVVAAGSRSGQDGDGIGLLQQNGTPPSAR